MSLLQLFIANGEQPNVVMYVETGIINKNVFETSLQFTSEHALYWCFVVISNVHKRCFHLDLTRCF